MTASQAVAIIICILEFELETTTQDRGHNDAWGQDVRAALKWLKSLQGEAVTALQKNGKTTEIP